ncbi:MAG: VOC family protein [Planctomycetes bacterium]|nr:VOC family protein [Planctomycetota bacterium]MCC7170676.1 VOC family protein [Planctomycetota bacterium]
MVPRKPKRSTSQSGAGSKAKLAKRVRTSNPTSTRRPAKSATDLALFRLNVEVGDLDAAERFYGALFGTTPRRSRGARFYLDCGPVTLQVVDVSSVSAPHPAAKALYFTTRALESVFERAQALHCLADDDVHGAPAGSIVLRPWGERSFYAEDPWGNPLCFVDAKTVFRG